MTGRKRKFNGALFLLTLAVAASGVLPLVGGVLAAQSPPPAWSPTQEPMSVGRAYHAASVLMGPECDTSSRPDYCGKVLVVGGTADPDLAGGDRDLSSVELYDPKTGSWSSCPAGSGRTPSSNCPGSMEGKRKLPKTAVLQGTQCGDNCGRVLVTGSTGFNQERAAELYNPETGNWESVPIPSSLQGVGLNHTATSLPTGEILIVGRTDTFMGYPGLLFSPIEKGWSETASPNIAPRQNHAAILIEGPNCGANCGKVLIASGGAGGADPGGRTAELYDPATKTFAPTGSPVYLVGPVVTLENGKILAAALGTETQIYDPATGVWTPSGALTGGAREALMGLSGNRILAVGGPEKSSEMYFPDEVGSNGLPGVWKVIPNGAMNEVRDYAQTVSLGCEAGTGRVLAAGGSDSGPPVATAEIFNRRVTVSGLQPASGRVTGGVPVTIRGTGFTPAFSENPKVLFGAGEAASVKVESDTELTVIPPAGAEPKKVDVTVSVDGVLPECSPELGFTYLPIPQLSGIDPPSGLALGGTRVTLTGTGFSPGSTVRFAGRPAGDVSVSSDGTKITAETPPGDPGTAPVSVTSPAGDVVETTFTYLPAISGVVPDTGPPEGGTLVTIAGKGLSGARTVTFDGIEVAPSGVTDSSLTVRTPPHPPGRVRVGVEVPPHGQAVPVSAGVDAFTYGSEAVVPASGAGNSQTLGGGSLTPNSGTTTSGGGPTGGGGSGPPPPPQGQAVPVLDQSPVGAFETGAAPMPGPSSVQSGSFAPEQSPAALRAPAGSGSEAAGPLPALVNVPELNPDGAGEYAMVAHTGTGIDQAWIVPSAGLMGLLLCGGLVLGRSQEYARPQARVQEAF